MSNHTTRPRLPTPAGACDSHFHIYDRSRPTLPDAPMPVLSGALEDYQRLQKRLGLSRAVVVHLSTQYGHDHSIALHAMKVLGGHDKGHDNARGIAIIAEDTSDAEIERLHKAGMRGIRFAGVTGATPYSSLLTMEGVQKLAPRIAQYGWHVQIQQIGNLLADIEPVLSTLPCDIVVDHMGRFPLPVEPGNRHWAALRKLLDGGRCWVKLSAAYHGSKVGPPTYADNEALAWELITAAPERMVWGTNWPHPPIRENLPDEAHMLDLLSDWTPDEATRQRILVDNPEKLYGFPKQRPQPAA